MVQPSINRGRRVVLALVVAMSLLTLAGAVHASERGGKARAKSAQPAPECRKDSECVAVPAECCGCTEGGAAKAIPDRAKETEQQARAGRCAGTVCIQVMSSDPSCSSRPVCRSGVCTLSSSGASKATGKQRRRRH